MDKKDLALLAKIALRTQNKKLALLVKKIAIDFTSVVINKKDKYSIIGKIPGNSAKLLLSKEKMEYYRSRSIKIYRVYTLEKDNKKFYLIQYDKNQWDLLNDKFKDAGIVNYRKFTSV